MIPKILGIALIALACRPIGTEAGNPAQTEYDYLKAQIDKHWNERKSAAKYAERWIDKARVNCDYRRLCEGYGFMMHLSGTPCRLVYADSAILAALRTNDEKLIGSSYLSRGIAYYEVKLRKEALDDFVTANRYIAATRDAYLIHKIKYQIAQTKHFLGYHHEAVSLFRECVAYFATENDRAHLNSLHGLGLAAQASGNSQECTQANLLGMSLCGQYDIPEPLPYFHQSEGINQTLTENYEAALPLLNKSALEFENAGDDPAMIVSKFYIGTCYWKLGDREKALPYLKKIDSMFIKRGYIRPDLRQAYQYLLEYYKNKEDRDAQLDYSKKLRQADSALHQDFRHMVGKTMKGYDTAEIITEKAAALTKNKKLTYWGIITIGSLACGFVIFAVRQTRKTKEYRLKFEAIMATEARPATPRPRRDREDIGISPEVVQLLLRNLEDFEAEKKFLEPDMNLNKMAAIMQTNSKYISRVILHYRGKKSIEYITELKLEHIVECLKTERRYRRYTNKALASEAGFGSTQVFSRAFRERYGISPSYFVRQLLESESANTARE